MDQYLNNAKEILLKDNEEHFSGARRDMEGWHGTAAEGFFNYLNQLDDGVTLLIDRIDTLKMILSAYQALHLQMRREVCDLVKHTLDGVAAAKTDGWEVGGAIAGAIFSVASAAAGAAAGGPPGAVLGSIAGSMIAGALGVAVEAKGANSELGVIVEFVNSGEAMLNLIDGERAKLEKAFRGLAETMTNNNLPEVRPDRPVLITAPDFQPGTFGLSNSDQGRHRRPTDSRDLVPEPKKRADGPYDQSTKDGKPHDRYPEQGR